MSTETTTGVGLKLVLLDRNFTLNSNVAKNYKYMLDPRVVLYIISETSQTFTKVQGSKIEGPTIIWGQC